jgi:cobalt-zinc-cadmium efflux system protein
MDTRERTNMSRSHDDHALAEGAMDTRLWASAGLNAAITVAEVLGGIASGSVSLLSDAAHNASDVMAVVLALWARRLGRRPATARHTYGFRRAEVVAALANAVTLIVVTALIAREAVGRLLHPEPVARGVMLAVALGAFVANVASVFLLRRHREEDVNVRSAFLHMAQDALASLAVVVAALLAGTAVGPWVDPAAAILVGLVVLRSAVSLVWETVSTLLEGAPAGVDVEELAASVAKAFGEGRLHHVHVWQAGPGQLLLTGHVTVDAEESAKAVESLLTEIKTLLHEKWGVSHATLEPEVTECETNGLLGSWDEPRDTGA